MNAVLPPKPDLMVRAHNFNPLTPAFKLPANARPGRRNVSPLKKVALPP
jgi:hypothetical protein